MNNVIYLHIVCSSSWRPGIVALHWRHNGRNGVSITNLTSVYWTVCSGEDQRKHQISASLAFVWGIHRWPVNYSHKWTIARKMFPLDDITMMKSTSASVTNCHVRKILVCFLEIQWIQYDRSLFITGAYSIEKHEGLVRDIIMTCNKKIYKITPTKYISSQC